MRFDARWCVGVQSWLPLTNYVLEHSVYESGARHPTELTNFIDVGFQVIGATKIQ